MSVSKAKICKGNLIILSSCFIGKPNSEFRKIFGQVCEDLNSNLPASIIPANSDYYELSKVSNTWANFPGRNLITEVLQLD